MYNEIDRLNLNSIDMLEYIELEDDVSDIQRALTLNRQRNNNYIIFSKIRMKAGLAIIRLFILYIFFYLDNKEITNFLYSLISFLLIHEGLIITNCTISYLYYWYLHFTSERTFSIPSLSVYLDIFNNFLFFTWFLYGNILILSDREGVEMSLQNNKMLTYYITVLILLGFFIYSKLIFYIIFFVSFCPCITYVLCFDIQQDFNHQRRMTRLQNRLKEELYEEYRKKNPMPLDCCSICTGEYMDKDYIITLPCDVRHYFHAVCIKKWLENKTICPLCRIDLRTPNNEEHLLNQNSENINIVLDRDQINHNANMDINNLHNNHIENNLVYNLQIENNNEELNNNDNIQNQPAENRN